MIVSIIVFARGFAESFSKDSTLVRKIKEKTNKDLEDSMLDFILKTVRAVIYIIAGFMIITLLGFNLNGLIAGLGVGGVIITLAAQDTAKNLGMNITFANIHSSDVFYKENDNFKELNEKYDCVACEMESFALFHNANVLSKNAACLLTVVDSHFDKRVVTSLERQTSLNTMINLALESIVPLGK